ncbi:MAG: HAMP domain-containing sensor histidine kinase [Pseudomonadota bacterium]
MSDAMQTPGNDFLARLVDELVQDISYLDGVIVDLQAQARQSREQEQKRISDSLELTRAANEALVLSALEARDSSAASDIDSQRKTLFLSMLSHELRSPLGAIVTATSLLERQVADVAGTAKTIAIVKRQAAQLVGLVDDLLDASRISSGKITLQRSWIKLNDVLDSALEAAQPLFEAQQQTVAFEMACEPPRVFGDSVRLIQLFSNLLANASKFSAPGTIVGVLVAAQAASVSVAVSDQGQGIAPAAQKDVFSLFAQAGQNQRHAGTGGMGIGLPLARTLAELHGGTLALYSEGIGQGSTFTVVLPCRPHPLDRRSSRDPERIG